MKSKKYQRRMIVAIDPEQLMLFLEKSGVLGELDLPADARIFKSFTDSSAQEINIMVESDSLPEEMRYRGHEHFLNVMFPDPDLPQMRSEP